MNSPKFPNPCFHKKHMKVEDQYDSGIQPVPLQENFSGEMLNVTQMRNLSKDISSVQNLQIPVEHNGPFLKHIEGTNQQNQPALLLYSPTFNTLDNRFEEMNTENSGVNIGGLGANGSGEQEINANIFTDSTWPGL